MIAPFVSPMTPRSPSFTSNPRAVLVVGPKPRNLGIAARNSDRKNAAASSGVSFDKDLIVNIESNVSSLTPPNGHPSLGNKTCGISLGV